MDFIPERYKHFKKYEFERTIIDIFIVEVGDDFEGQIRIFEGEYGKWFGETEIANESRLINEDKAVLVDIYDLLRDAGKL